MTTRVLAPCKINPTLVVIERRPDGFHELDLTYLALELADELELEPARGRAGALRVEGPAASSDVPADEKNLALRAARSVLALAPAGAAEDFDLRLVKRIPSQAGLGGGSSDAAAAALGVSLAHGIPADDPRLRAALAALGSDAVFFLAARETGHARGRGRGERIEVLPVLAPPPWVVLLAPAFGARTADVYRALEAPRDPASNRKRGEASTSAWSSAKTNDERRRALCNDLEAAALRAFSELASWRAFLDRRGAEHFRLAGSGSTFFGLFAEESEARAELERLARDASSRGLATRGTWVARASGHGARAIA